MSAMKRLFQIMADKKASDIFISVGAPINIKINGQLVPVNQTMMTPDTVQQLLFEVLTERQVKEYEDEMELNTAFALEGVGSFRISAFRQKGSPAVVVRYIPGSIPPLDSLGLPEVLREIIMQKRGLILMVGATGCGKSTSLAAMLDYRNGLKSGHILTLEDPVEFIFTNKKSIVNQREVGTDTKAFEVALKNALRQAPDCILIGEIRDKQTMGMSLAYAQSGHLCLATLHANNSYHAAAQHPAHRRTDREGRDQRDQGSPGEEHGARLADLRAGAVQAVHGRQDHPGGSHVERRLRDQHAVAHQPGHRGRDHGFRRQVGRPGGAKGRNPGEALGRRRRQVLRQFQDRHECLRRAP